jgi:hypothetical protein
MLVKVNKIYWSVVDSSVSSTHSFSHEGPWFTSLYGRLFVLLLICDPKWLFERRASMVDRLLLEPIRWMTKIHYCTMYAERDHLKNCLTCIIFVIQPICCAKLIKNRHQSSPITFIKKYLYWSLPWIVGVCGRYNAATCIADQYVSILK